jgi:signal transduction histidine kinase
VRERTVHRLAWGLWVLGIMVGAAAVVFLILSWNAPAPPGSFGFRGFALLFVVGFATPGALIAAKQPDNPIGWIFLGVGLLAGVEELGAQYAMWAVVQEGGGFPLERVAAWLPAWLWIPGTGGAMFVLMLFPDGRLPSRRWRWALVVGVVGAVVSSVAFAVLPGPLQNFSPIENPFAVGTHRTVTALAVVGQFFYGLGIILAAVALILRFRRSKGDERQQLKWLATAGSFLSLSLVVSFLLQVLEPQLYGAGADRFVAGQLVALTVIAGFSSLPIATAFAILKYRLYDIDLVIRKTAVYAILAVLLFALGIPIAWVFGRIAVAGFGGNDTSAYLAGGIVIGLAVWPLRGLATRIADRLVFGRRASPYQVLTEFSDRVSETYAAEDVLERMAQVLATGLGAEAGVVWIRGRDGFHVGATWPADASAGTSMPADAIEVRHRDEVLGALSVRMPANDPMTPAKELLIRDLAAQAGLVLRNAKLIEDLKASRQRLVAAQDLERRRIERNIHDGAQQQLVALAVKLKLADTLVGKDEEGAHAMLADLQTETNQALEDLRDLARGIYPPLLADKGLGAALESQGRKSAVPVSVETDGIGRYPQETEAAVYFSCLEALQNVAKYAGATKATVRLAQTNGDLTFEVSDDGIGFDPAAASRGSGLQGIADRLAALGGELDVRSAPGDGTTVAGRLPVALREGSP